MLLWHPKAVRISLFWCRQTTNLKLDEATIKAYRDKIITHMIETMNLEGLEDRIIFERVFTGHDFSTLYNAYKGTALGLAQKPNAKLPYFDPKRSQPK